MKIRYLMALSLAVCLTGATAYFAGVFTGYQAAPREVVTVDSRIQVAEAIRRLRLEPIALPIHDHLDYNNFATFNNAWFPGANKWLYGKGVRLEGSGFVTAVFDLGHVRATNIRQVGDGFVVNIGKPEIGWTVLPNEMVRDTAEPYKGANVSQGEMSEWQRQARMQMERNLRAAACSANIFDQASAEVKKSLPSFVAIASGNVRVTFETKASHC